jgi:hypothetical protein
MMPAVRIVLAAVVWLIACEPARGTEGAEKDKDAAPSREEAARALRRAVEFFRTRVAVEGGYLWRYSEDLTVRQGEGKASTTQAWVQPPGTPAVGMAFLRAHRVTRDGYYLEAARETAGALLRGQLRSGGWHYSIELDPAKRKAIAYRAGGGGERARNWTTLDDDTTQATVRFLMQLDRATGFKDGEVHEAVLFALASLLQAQYPNGAWPQGYERFPDPDRFPVKKASYPGSWPRVHVKSDYWGHYTLNDNVLKTMVETLFEAEGVYGDERYSAAARRAGEFLLLAQMPEPQPAWAQQYDADMRPAWARKFEPPAVTGGESQGALEVLLVLHRATGEARFLEPVPRALAYLRRSRLPDGRLARFYELESNQPLYFTRGYELTHSDADLPGHYAFKVADRTERIERELARLQESGAAKPGEPPGEAKPDPPRRREGLAARVRETISGLDARGAWVEEGRLDHADPGGPPRRVIDCATFARNAGILCDYLEE